MKLAPVLMTSLILAAAACSAQSQAALLAYEGFDTPTTGVLSGQSGDTSLGWTGNWYDAAPSGNVTAAGLNYSTLEVVGGAANMDGSGTTTSYRDLNQIYDASQGETWVSFLAQSNQVATSSFLGMNFYNSGGNANNPNGEIAVSTTSDGTDPAVWRLFDPVTSMSDLSGVPVTVGQTELMVMQIVWDDPGLTAPNNDRVHLWVSPDITGGGFGSPESTLITDILDFDTARFASQNGVDITFDELRIGTSAADVIPGGIVPEPASGVLVFSFAAALLGWRLRSFAGTN